MKRLRGPSPRQTPDQSPKQHLTAASQFDRFRAAIHIDDRIVSYDPQRREYLLGSVASEPLFDLGVVEGLVNYRQVNWDGAVQRDRLSASSRDSLGAIQTLFRLPEECAAELEQRAQAPLALTVAEAKHRKGAMGAQEIRSFIGGRHKDDKGLYVSTGGFSKDARYEADRAGIPLTLMDLDDLVSAVVEYYEQLDGDSKALVRLRRIYWPA